MKGHQWQWFYKIAIEQDFSFYLSIFSVFLSFCLSVLLTFCPSLFFLFLLELGSLNGVGLILMEQWSVSKVWVNIVHLRGSVSKINFVRIKVCSIKFRSKHSILSVFTVFTTKFNGSDVIRQSKYSTRLRLMRRRQQQNNNKWNVYL